MTAEMCAARDLLDECETTDAALRAVLFAMGQPGTSPEFWLGVYAHVETMGMVREAIKRTRLELE